MRAEIDKDIKDLLWYKVGGKTKIFLDCKNKKDILEALDYIDKHKITNHLIIGQGSNLIFTSDYFDGAIIRIVGHEPIEIDNEKIMSFSGNVLDDVITESFANNLIGLEWAGGLPGTIGAGVRGNVGAFGGEIKDNFESAEIAILENGRVEQLTFNKDDLHFAYRESTVKENKNMIILTSSHILKKANEQELQNAKEVYEKNTNYRRERHPIEYPNCGSVFKNIVKKEEVEKIFSVAPDIKTKSLSDWYGKVSMGYLINSLGFSGKQVGGAQVSTKHANFIINKGDAKGTDVIQLIEQIQKAVEDKYGIVPEVEPELIS